MKYNSYFCTKLKREDDEKIIVYHVHAGAYDLMGTG